jgi:hypothetical protein
MKKTISIITILMFSFVLCVMGARNIAIAEENEECVGEECTVDGEEADRTQSWHETQTGTTAWGGTFISGQFGPDVGIGETGQYYQSIDPLTGATTSFYTTGLGSGIGGALAGYGGMFSQYGQDSYGPYAGGNRPQVQPTPGYDTQG